MKERISDN